MCEFENSDRSCVQYSRARFFTLTCQLNVFAQLHDDDVEKFVRPKSRTFAVEWYWNSGIFKYGGKIFFGKKAGIFEKTWFFPNQEMVANLLYNECKMVKFLEQDFWRKSGFFENGMWKISQYTYYKIWFLSKKFPLKLSSKLEGGKNPGGSRRLILYMRKVNRTNSDP